jgi:uncharacterized protein involved in exopolysaccharide biosynthesis
MTARLSKEAEKQVAASIAAAFKQHAAEHAIDLMALREQLETIQKEVAALNKRLNALEDRLALYIETET